MTAGGPGGTLPIAAGPGRLTLSRARARLGGPLGRVSLRVIRRQRSRPAAITVPHPAAGPGYRFFRLVNARRLPVAVAAGVWTIVGGHTLWPDGRDSPGDSDTLLSETTGAGTLLSETSRRRTTPTRGDPRPPDPPRVQILKLRLQA